MFFFLFSFSKLGRDRKEQKNLKHLRSSRCLFETCGLCQTISRVDAEHPELKSYPSSTLVTLKNGQGTLNVSFVIETAMWG